MGTEMAPKDFYNNCSTAVHAWNLTLKNDDRRYSWFIARDPVSQTDVDLSNVVLVNDITRLLIVFGCQDAIKTIRHSNS